MLYLGASTLTPPAQQTAGEIDWQRYYQQQANASQPPLLQHFYQAGMVSSATAIQDVPLLALDIETTGLDPASNGIVSIGTVPFNLHTIYSSQARQWLVKPRFALSDASVTLHRITHSDIAAAPDLTDILPQLLQQMAGKVAVVHYHGIERPFLHAAVKTRLGAGLLFPLIDTMQLEARMHRRKPLSFWQKLRGQQPVSIRLADSRLRYGLPPYRPHHAVTDALACAELLHAQLSRHYCADTPLSQLWC
ncbi:3'-5' exonuclease [Rheinheimera nanhaiensis]|uniref:DNA polymerase III subunit epsilon n=1 Tax=Rheinheimera nanhaiensis E407-8 TaxID=562729 RepID=I1DXN4_9GAMM|nr:3'-5' exonuclease [Rheinheimera nanhaiensis]GAB58812.1 DNA polymerase III subunit epsilon [Rheinheimera nanhaiensis E407-8]